MNKLVEKVFGKKSKSSSSDVSQQNYKAIFDSVDDALFIHDIKTGEILDVNKKMLQMYGYTREESLLKKVEMFSSGVSPYDQENAEAKFELAATGDPQVFEWQAKTKIGRLFWVEVSLVKVVLDGIDKIIAIVRDITERKDLEEQKIFINKAKSEFISIAAHQLRTPLGSMRWNTELLLENAKEYNLTAEAIDLIKKNYKSNLEVVDLINSLLNVSRIDQDKVKSDFKGFSLSELIEEIIYELGYEARSKSVDIKFRVNRNRRYFIRMDRKQIKEALSNVIGNAIKYSFQKTEVSISLNKKEEFYEIKTSNIGIGIPTCDREHIFDKFFRAKNTIKLGSRGSGLGLFIAKSFIERIDGSISFSSNEDKRTIFIVKIPISITR